eukprot:Amastigsp_a348753_5.p4 type:complete len:142 gc:universal Amastigsp_a348753_5:967-542(-)
MGAANTATSRASASTLELVTLSPGAPLRQYACSPLEPPSPMPRLFMYSPRSSSSASAEPLLLWSGSPLRRCRSRCALMRRARSTISRVRAMSASMSANADCSAASRCRFSSSTRRRRPAMPACAAENGCRESDLGCADATP